MTTEIPFIRGPGHFLTNVSGSQQVNLVALCGPRRQEKLNIKVRARLVLDDDQLVQVSIEGHEVGYLSRQHTAALRRIVRYGIRSVHETFECAALICGVLGDYRVRLDLPSDE